MKRHEIREKALQVLFQLDNTDLTLEEAISHVFEENQELDPFSKSWFLGFMKICENLMKS